MGCIPGWLQMRYQRAGGADPDSDSRNQMLRFKVNASKDIRYSRN